MFVGMETLGEELLALAAVSFGYSLGSLHERCRSSKRKRADLAAEMYLEAQIELKRIQFAVKRIRSNADFTEQLNRLRRFFEANFELLELYPVNGAFCTQWLAPVAKVIWDDSAKVRFRDAVERLRAE
jgi:hypothetical protein